MAKKISQNNIIIAPRITEKGAISAESNSYIFEVHPSATKTQIKKAIELVYKVSPVSVNITKIPAKRVFVKGKKGVVSGGKKAYVYLKKGDQIQIM